MRIVPTYSIAIAGHHCEAGQLIEVADSIAAQLIAERQATRAPADAAAPVVETAAVAPVVETAAAAAKAPRKLKA
jgi:hypothetical protein